MFYIVVGKTQYKYTSLWSVFWELWLQPSLIQSKQLFSIPNIHFSSHSFAKQDLSTWLFCKPCYSFPSSNPGERKGGIKNWEDHQVCFSFEITDSTMCKSLTWWAPSASWMRCPCCWKSKGFRWPYVATLQLSVYLRCMRWVQGDFKKAHSCVDKHKSV